MRLIGCMQAYLPKADMMASAERQMVTVTNQVGVDLSQLHSQEWRQATLPYVAGLGQRKARALLRTLAASDAPTTRKALKETLGEVVWRNAVGFLRVRRVDNSHAEGHLEILDNTRVHPEHYSQAIQIATEATDIDQELSSKEERAEAICKAFEK